jgi:hypothetical protein
MSENNLEEAQFEEVIPTPQADKGFAYQDLGMMDNDVEEERSESISDDIAEFDKTSEQYRQSKIDDAQMFLNPATGEMVERTKLPKLEQIKIVAKSTGTVINDPKKDCKKCHGRGYTGTKLDGSPVACECLYEDFFAANKEAAEEQMRKNYPAMNRQSKRRYQKQLNRYFTSEFAKMKKNQEIIDNSKANLGKITPVKPKIVPETVTENVVEEVTEEV